MLEIDIKSTWFDTKAKLCIKPESLEIEKKTFWGSKLISIPKDSVVKFRYGLKWIQIYHFTIGRIYFVDIVDTKGRLSKIRMWGFNKNEILEGTEQYEKTLNALFDCYFDDISQKFLDKFNKVVNFEILDVIFSEIGIDFNDKRGIIKWNDVGTSSFQDYYSIYSKSNPLVYKSFEYGNEWNVGVLYSVSRQILKEKGLWSE